MRVVLCKDYNEISEYAARLVASQLTLKPDSVLGLATGSTPIGMYNKLASMYKKGDIDFSQATTFNLDEYWPIEKKNTQSYDYFMKKNFFSKVNVPSENIHIPNGETEDPEMECKTYEKSINEKGGIDLQILGIGQNGHIGFNEPDVYLNSYTHLTGLTSSTLEANSRFFGKDEKIPEKALTMGISTILKSKKIVLLASGANKNRAVSALLDEEINTDIPATMLKTHPDVVLICDHDAYLGSRLGVDIGGTNVKFAVVEGKKIQYTGSIPTETKSADALIKSIAKECVRIKKKYPIKTIGAGTPGLIHDGHVSAVNLPFEDVALAKLLSNETKMPVNIDNDANCAALGETIFGAGKDCENIIMVTLGTGVGGGIIINKKICHGKYSMGEIGHIIVQHENGRKCTCGQYGCWEQYASASALVRDAQDAAQNNTDSILYKLMNENGKLNGKLIFDAIEQNCPVAKSVFDKYTDWLAVGIKSLMNIFGPDAIILAGGITMQGDKLINPLKEKLNTNIKIEISTLQNDAGALGAAML